MSDRLEARALLAMLRQRWDEVDVAIAERSFQPDVLVALARAADVAPTVHALVTSAARLERLGAAGAELTRIRAKTRVDNLLLLARLEQALDRLGAAGIRPIALKGVDVLPRFYTAFDERTLDDIDLLVRRDERDAAIAALVEAGWKAPPEPERTHWLRSSFEMPLVAPGPVGVILEIHWSLGQDVRYRIDDDALFARALPHTIEGRALFRLDEHDAVAHLLVHHVQHYFDRRLKWVVELGRRAASPGFSWPAVAERLRTWGGFGAAGLALAHIRKLFPEIAPDDAVRAVPADLWRLAVTLPLRSTHPLDFYRGTRRRAVQLFLAAACLERPRDLPAYVRHRAVRDESVG